MLPQPEPVPAASPEFHPTKKQQEVLSAKGHLLVTGGPGSGKTTISILKAADIVRRELRIEQRVLFLSFARATVSRVIEAIDEEKRIRLDEKRRIDVDTYHSFFWRILKAHGYLLGLPRRLHIVPPSGEAIALSVIRSRFAPDSKLKDVEKAEKRRLEDEARVRLARQEGRVCFDLFAPLVGDILVESDRIRRLVAAMFPVVVLDEFQDTNPEQWRVVKALGEHSRLFALGDPEQRIYDFIGADPARLQHYRDHFMPTEIDLSTENHRSAGTDIGAFGNDILKGEFRQSKYSGVEVVGYDSFDAPAKAALMAATYAARSRLLKTGGKWSLAILVPTRKMTRIVSDTFRSPPASMTPIQHVASVEIEAAVLAAEIIAFLMQPDTSGHHLDHFITLLCNYFHGKGGDTPAKGDLREAEAIRKAYSDRVERKASGRTPRRSSIANAVIDVYFAARGISLSGNPDEDWTSIRRCLEAGSCPRLSGLASEARNIRLLERGTLLRQELASNWRDHGSYRDALTIAQNAFLREHMSTLVKPERGVVVMNMHKAKGKQFDEVIVFEGWPIRAGGRIVANADRIVRSNDPANMEQARQNFRVSVTRGKKRTTILTPKDDPCVLLIAKR